MQAVQAYLEGIWGDAAARFRLVAENTDPEPGDDRPAPDVLRRGLLGRARLRRVDVGDRHVVATRPHRDRAAPTSTSSSRAASAGGSTSARPTASSTTGAR